MAPNWDYQAPYPQNPKPPKATLAREISVGVPDGSDITALKRGCSRGGRWPWAAFDDTYSKSFANGKSGGNVSDSGIKGFQRQSGLDDDGVVGPDTFNAMLKAMVPEGLPHQGEPLFDKTALDMLDAAADNPPSGGGGEGSLSDYARDSIYNEPRIHYSQNRAMTHLGVPPSQGFTADCSGHATSCYYEAGWPDPNKSDYNGYGYTGTLANNPKVGSPYKVGDLGLYGDSWGATSHVVTCYVAGDSSNSVWVSHGSEGAPTSVRLYYRSDLLGVVRPPKS
jgi:Putative peptidoglycan binding domain